ncbi:uncharacterized protein L3040_008795 [Drepanopeziza brunnea f. sp. 'multigermtubi']|uniref:uncharacterized protein n=1 Tax=Drepanopeziza brunnea f. sp. 'multigermtubi' TaxID=698441 RepID=UPI002383F1F2|nr:hypothetical protein L3040_008795 [Drepanopeziza brunnea f. sp. 'multigermtubi']
MKRRSSNTLILLEGPSYFICKHLFRIRSINLTESFTGLTRKTLPLLLLKEVLSSDTGNRACSRWGTYVITEPAVAEVHSS